MQLTKLKERTSFIFGDQNMPTPGKLCLIKLTESYIKRLNRIFNTSYVVGMLEIRGKKAFLVENSNKDNRKYYNYNRDERSCTWSSNIIEKWYYIEDIEKKIK